MQFFTTYLLQSMDSYVLPSIYASKAHVIFKRNHILILFIPQISKNLSELLLFGGDLSIDGSFDPIWCENCENLLSPMFMHDDVNNLLDPRFPSVLSQFHKFLNFHVYILRHMSRACIFLLW